MTSRARSFGALRCQSGFLKLLGVLTATAAVIGLGTGRPGMATIGVPLCALFFWSGWLISPAHVQHRTARRGADLQDRFFARLGIAWLSDPALRRKSLDDPHDDEGASAAGD
jgi:hypothetical protein